MTGFTTVTRTHAICMGHRVCGHESKCAHLHGHNYRFHLTCEAPHLDSIGRVIDFSVIKDLLCNWLELHWDHRFLAYENDPVLQSILNAVMQDEDSGLGHPDALPTFTNSIVWVPFNPTAENIAQHLVEVVGPTVFAGTDVRLVSVTVDETDKCSATYTLGGAS